MIVSPSLLSADFGHLDREMKMINESQAEWLHLDIMDGVFVPNISFGFPVIKSLKPLCIKKFDAHFMIINPEKYIDRTAELGVYMMTIHAEVVDDLPAIVDKIHAAGMKAGVSVKPSSPIEMLDPVLDTADMFLVMSVEPGFSGQKFHPETLERVAALKAKLLKINSSALIQVDGGVNASNCQALCNAGVDVFVCGDYVFKAPNPKEVISNLVALTPTHTA